MNKKDISKENEDNYSKENSKIDLDFVIKFKDISNVIYEIKQKDVNANEEDLKIFFENLIITVKMLEKTIVNNSLF